MRLKECCILLTDGNWIESKDQSESGIRLIQTGNVGNGEFLEKENRAKYISKDTFTRLKCTEIYPGDILVSRLPEPVGRACIIPIKNERMITAVDCSILRVNEQIIQKRYLLHFLKSQSYFTQLTGKLAGTTRVRISRKNLEQVEIDIPSFQQQTKIVSILDHLEQVITKRKNELQALDELIKARFVEMFGDPEMNPCGWQKTGISNIVCGKVSNGYFAKREDYVDNGNVAILGVAYVVNRMYSQVEGLPRTNAIPTDILKHKVQYGDMLFCRSSLVAEGIGKASIVPENVPDNTLFECHVIRLPLDLDKCIPEFMQVLSTTDYFRKQMIAQSKTATMTTIGQDGILKANIILPPIEKQREFYLFVKQVDKSKVVVQEALDEAQFLFDSLMQQYFG